MSQTSEVRNLHLFHFLLNTQCVIVAFGATAHPPSPRREKQDTREGGGAMGSTSIADQLISGEALAYTTLPLGSDTGRSYDAVRPYTSATRQHIYFTYAPILHWITRLAQRPDASTHFPQTVLCPGCR